VWARYGTWREVALRLIRATCGQEVIRAFLQAPPRHVLVGNSEWLRPFAGGDLSQDFVDALNSAWTHIRAFHGCSVTAVETYYGAGLRPLSLRRTNEWAREYFLRVCPRLTNESVDHAIARTGQDYDQRDEKVCLALDSSHLVSHCAHYLVYGSEYLLALATELMPEDGEGEPCDFRQYLRDRGLPTVFVCDVPIRRVDAGAREELARILLAETFRWLIDPNHVPRSRRFGFPISRTLEPKHIVTHFHPSAESLVDSLEPFVCASPSCKLGISCQGPGL